jgi:hypothetical protein
MRQPSDGLALGDLAGLLPIEAGVNKHPLQQPLMLINGATSVEPFLATEMAPREHLKNKLGNRLTRATNSFCCTVTS